MATPAARYQPKAEPLPHYARASTLLLAEEPAEAQPQTVSRAEQKKWEIIYNHCESRLQALYAWRVSWWNTWSQIARWSQPYRYYYFIVENIYNKGLREDFAILDRTPTQAGEICAAGLMATLTDPDRNWLELGSAIPNYELDRAAERYYQDLTERLNYIYDHCNFYDSQAQQYNDLTFYGTGVTIDYEDDEKIINCVTPCAGEYMLANNFDFDSETLYREYRMTVSQIVQMFGLENCPEDIQAMWRQKGGALEYERVIAHAIEPNFAIAGGGAANDDNVGVVEGGFAWREIFWMRGKKGAKPLSMTGFKEQPFSTARWNTQGNEPYGRGVGENMLGDSIQLQFMTRQQATSIEKLNAPPMGADVALMNQPSSTSPNKITYMNTAGGGEKKFWPLYQLNPGVITPLAASMQEVRERIRNTAYNDVFQRLMMLRQQMKLKADITATEVEQLTEEALMRLGPMMFRCYGALRQRVRRHLNIMARKGLLPPKPASLRGVPTKIDFVSLLTQARRQIRTRAITEVGQFAGTLSGAWPEVKYKFDANKALDLFASGLGTDPSILRTDDETQALIQREQQDQKMQQLMAQTLPGAKAAQALGSTSLAPGTALSALVQPS